VKPPPQGHRLVVSKPNSVSDDSLTASRSLETRYGSTFVAAPGHEPLQPTTPHGSHPTNWDVSRGAP
jgi:hypothetical protein